MFRKSPIAAAALLSACAAWPAHAADPPTVESLDFDSMPIAAPGMKDVELILAALGGKAQEKDAVERAWRILATVCDSDAADVVRLAGAPFVRKNIDAVYREVLGRPATPVELLRWAATTRPVEDPKVLAARLRRIRAAKDRKLRGVVVDAKDRPVEGAVVRDLWSDWRTETDAEGKFTFDSFSPQDYGRKIHAEKGDLVGRFGTFRYDMEESLPRIRIEPRRKVAASFLDPSGKPLPNAAYFGSFGWQATPREPGFILTGNCIAPTNEKGKATVDELMESDSILMPTARHRRYVWDEPHRDEGVPTEFRFKAGVEIHGVVVDPNGRPLAGASVSWQAAKAGLRPANIRHIADRQGRFAFVANPVDCALRAEHPDWACTVVEFSVEDVNRGKAIELKLSEGEYIEGRVLRDGHPAPGVDVHNLILQLPAGGVNPPMIHHPRNWTISDEEGRFRIGPLPKAASYQVYASDAALYGAPNGRALARSGQKDVVIEISSPK